MSKNTSAVGSDRQEFEALSRRNRRLIAEMFDPSRSIGEAYLENLADCVRFRIIGSGIWSGTWANKFEFLTNVFFALANELDGIIGLEAEWILVEGDNACVRARGRSRVKNGRRYDNTYCMVYQLAGGKIVGVTEYLDTEHVTYSFGARDQHHVTPVRQPQAANEVPAVEPDTYFSSTQQTSDPAAVAIKNTVTALYSEPRVDFIGAFLALMDDDVKYTLDGRTRFSGIYNGKRATREHLFEPLLSELDGPYREIADNIFVDGEHVCVQAHGLGRAKNGRRYDNDYCYVLSFADGRIQEVHQYSDTERSGPQILDSRLSEILVPVQAARSSAAGSKYTTSGVRRSSARCRRLAL